MKNKKVDSNKTVSKRKHPSLFWWSAFFTCLEVAFAIVIVGIFVYLQFFAKDFSFKPENVIVKDAWTESKNSFLNNILNLYVVAFAITLLVTVILWITYGVKSKETRKETSLNEEKSVIEVASEKRFVEETIIEEPTENSTEQTAPKVAEEIVQTKVVREEVQNLNKDKTLVEISRTKISRKQANQKVLVDLVSEKLIVKGIKVSKKLLTSYIDAMFDEIFKNAKSEDVILPGFGKFLMVVSPEKEMRNPFTGESVVVPETKQYKFKISSVLKDKMNENKKYKIPTIQQVKVVPLSSVKDGDVILKYVETVYDEATSSTK